MCFATIKFCTLITLLTLCASSNGISTSVPDYPAELMSMIQNMFHQQDNRTQLGTNSANATPCQLDKEEEPCPPSKYRSDSGLCNNVRHRHWGASGDIFLRLLKPDYANGVSSPRVSVTSHALPGPRQLTSLFKHVSPSPHPHVTSLVAVWGELLHRELAEPAQQLQNTTCCGGVQPAHPECYHHVDGVCLDYIRTAAALNQDTCKYSQREQLNSASGFIDGSSVYGTNEEVSHIRRFDNGLVDLKRCLRCNEGTPISVLIKALLTEHNRLASELSRLNQHWGDEDLFLEAQKILIAQIQHITYNEFLPTILGELSASKPELQLHQTGYFNGYSSSNRAGTFNEVAQAALPIFSTMMSAFQKSDKPTIKSLLGTSAQEATLFASDDSSSVMNYLLIHKARDHGIPAYTNALNLCGKKVPQNVTWEQLEEAGLAKKDIEYLKLAYGNVDDIDLIVGAILETPVEGAIFGPTLSCLLDLQFQKSRNSDRFWYENDLPPSSLTTDQLQAIRTVTLAGMLCSQGEKKQRIQPKAFITEDPYLNAGLLCNQLPHLQLTAWMDSDHMSLSDIPEDLLMDALEKAKQDMINRRKQEYENWERMGGLDPKSPAGTAAAFSKANRQALALANSSHFFEFTSNEILNSLNRRRKRQIFNDNNLGFNSAFSREEFTDSLQSVDVSSLLGSVAPTLEPECEEFGTSCDISTPFRTFSGHCNNLRNPTLGKSLTVFSRLLPAQYEDGLSQPKITGESGAPLPSPRVVSTLIHPDISNLHTRYSMMVMQYAQFLDHDLTMTPIHKGFHESVPDCRRCDSPRTVHPECNPFPVPPGDHYYPEINVTSGERMCFPFMRSLPGQQQLGPRQQVNQNTHFLDASQVYGENVCVFRDLRGYGGKMNSTAHPRRGKELLPRSPVHPECRAASGYCFIAGDGRASEQPGLTVIHTIFLREHNRIAEGLRQVNPHWSEDLIFEHARRILIAQNQHITYNELLPRLLSWNAVNLYGLKLLPQGYYKDYNPSCNPTILTEFASAAFRIGHSLLRPHLPRLSPTHQPVDPPILLRDGFFKTDMLMQPFMIDEMARGLVATPMEALDQFITGEVTNHLFEDRKIPFSGVDLVALNLQRGRDHGIPSYNNYRALCNLKKARTFEDLSREIPPEVITRLKRIYATVDDIDLFPGGMSERPLQGGLVGPTFACIIAIQFRQLRKCDRFWYENEDPVVRFSEAQLAEIRKTTLSKIICENMDVPGDMQRAAFDLPSNFLNPRVPCHTMPQINLNFWRDNVGHSCQIAGRTIGLGESAFPSPCTSCVCSNEGAQCASLRITDCAQLAREWSREQILADDVCSAQCGLVLASTPPRNNNFQPGRSQNNLRHIPGLVPPAPRHARNQRPFVPINFQGFKLPDLSPFIG